MCYSLTYFFQCTTNPPSLHILSSPSYLTLHLISSSRLAPFTSTLLSSVAAPTSTLALMYHRYPATWTWTITTTTMRRRGSDGMDRRTRRRIGATCCCNHTRFTDILFIYSRLLLPPHVPSPAPLFSPSAIAPPRPHALLSVLIRSIRSTRITSGNRECRAESGWYGFTRKEWLIPLLFLVWAALGLLLGILNRVKVREMGDQEGWGDGEGFE